MEFGLYFDVGDELDVVVAGWGEVNVLHDLRCFCPHIGAACTVVPAAKQVTDRSDIVRTAIRTA